MAWTRKSILPHLSPSFGEDRVDRRRIGDVAMAGDDRAELGGQRLDALLQRVALVGQRKFGSGIGAGLGDAPGDRTVVGDAHDDAALAVHQTGCLDHVLLLEPER